MDEEPRGIRTAEKLAGIVAIVAALVVLNGAWVNQHSWENVSWRVAVAGILIVLAIGVETNAFGVLREREREQDGAVPDFMRVTSDEAATPVEGEPAHADAVGARERG